jgi:acyl dehydratase
VSEQARDTSRSTVTALLSGEPVVLATHTATEQTSRAVFTGSRSAPARNPHVDPEAARRYGFDRLLISAPELLCVAEAPLATAFGADWIAGGLLELTYVRPVLADTELVLHAQRAPDSTPARLCLDLRIVAADAAADDPPRCVGRAEVDLSSGLAAPG